ncbi:MAG TPA: serine hydroxymethyltransferase [Xanthobacteraceae bacterium]|nr:serine hydroxymethyltransferase [Xanthobacteraceae bacterium]
MTGVVTGKAKAGEVIIEMRPVGAAVRVAAVDVATGTEVVVFGPATTPPRALEELAVAKLKRKLSTDSGR